MKLTTNDFCCVCSNCSKACPVAAPYYDGEKIAFDHEKCIGCGKCIRACHLGAIYDMENPPQAPAPHEPIRYDCDLCVIGAGASGLITAVKAAEAGKSVIILEKGAKSASSTPYATGLRMHDSQWEKDAGLPSRMEEMIATAKRNTGGQLNEKLIENTMHALPEFFDWCCTWANPEEYFTIKPNPFGSMGVDVKDSDHGAGIFVINRFPERAKALGVKILTSTPAKSLLQDDSGAIIGVEAEDAGGQVTVYSRYVMIATGSIINGESLKRKEPRYANAFTRRYGHRIYSLTGDGLTMAEKAGIPINYEQMAIAYIGRLCMPVDMQGIHFGRPIDTEMLCQIAKEKAVWINKDGKRWANEGIPGDVSLQLLEQPDCLSYTVMDHKILMEIPQNPATNGGPGGPGAPGAPKAPAGPAMMGTPGAVYGKPIDLEKLHEFAALKGAHLLIADSIPELAEKMGVPTEVFEKTIADYNAFCASGADTEMGKDARYLQPIECGPFYAFKTFLGTDGAFGGLNVNENMQVEGADGVIPNLFAGGDLCSSYFTVGGNRKNTIINDFTWAVASGTIAGDTIAAL